MEGKFSVELQTQPQNITAGEEVLLHLSVMDADQHMVNRLENTHEKPLHLIIVSKDLQEFYHLHPYQLEDGSFMIKHIFPYGGVFRLYADFTPVENQRTVQKLELSVDGNRREEIELTVDAETTKEVNGLDVKLNSGHLVAGKDSQLKVKIIDRLIHEPVTDLQIYLGTLAHIVIISKDSGEFLHVHSEGHFTDAAAHRHYMISSSEGLGSIITHTVFPTSGLYKIWIQFKRRDEVHIVPFVLKVE